MEELTKIFNNRQFGVLEVVLIDGKEFFPATDVAKMLGYTNPEKAIRGHCKTPGCTIRSVGVETGTKADGTPAIQIVQKKYINEGNLYRLITHSKLPAAEKFESWVFDEVIPDIRRTGVYGMSTAVSSDAAAMSSEMIAKIVAVTVTETIRQLMPLIGAEKQMQDDEPIAEEVVVTKIKRKKSPGKIEKMPESVQRAVNEMLYGVATFREIQDFLRISGFDDVGISAIARYKNNLLSGKIRRKG